MKGAVGGQGYNNTGEVELQLWHRLIFYFIFFQTTLILTLANHAKMGGWIFFSFLLLYGVLKLLSEAQSSPASHGL